MNLEQQLETDGYTIIKQALPLGYIMDFNSDIEKVASESQTEDVFTCEHGIKQIQNLQDRPEFIELANRLKVLIDKPKAKVMNMQYFIKYPNYKITSPHQDGAYFEDLTKNIVTFWIPLQDVDKDTSCLFYIPGSHKEGLIKHEAIGSNVRTRTGKTGYSQYCTKYFLTEFTEAKMNIGDVLIHDKLALHYSSVNKGLERRIAVTCIMEI